MNFKRHTEFVKMIGGKSKNITRQLKKQSKLMTYKSLAHIPYQPIKN